MDVGNLKCNPLRDHTAERHNLASAFAQVGDRFSVGDFIFYPIAGEIIFMDIDAGAKSRRHYSDASA